jgi:type II secretory ATPase GspE/PulE/Tfp pilus assembly ATPase PilB-like protein
MTQNPPATINSSTKDGAILLEKLHEIVHYIQSARHIDKILLEVNEGLRTLFQAERVTIFVPNNDDTIISKVATLLNGSRRLKLPLGPKSVAGYVAQRRTIVNIADAYDEAELKRINPKLRFMKAVDAQTGFHTKQLLAFPALSNDGKQLMAVIEVLNSISGKPFPPEAVTVAMEISKCMGIAFNPRRNPEGLKKTRFWPLIIQKILSVEDMEQAFRESRKNNTDVETYLIEHLHIDPKVIGVSYSVFFGVPFEPYDFTRVQPIDLLNSVSKDYVLANEWLPLNESEEDGLIVLTPEPEKVRNSDVVSQIFPKKEKITYKVCLKRDFLSTVDLFYNFHETDLAEYNEVEELKTSNQISAQDIQVIRLVNRIIIQAHSQGASDIHIEPQPDICKTEVRFRKDETLVNLTTIPFPFSSAIVSRIKSMCNLDISEIRRPQDGKIKFKKFGPLDIDLRVVTIPTNEELEDVVMHITARNALLPLEELGLNPNTEEKLKEIASKPYGLFFACGPTGSGTTTTLHSILSYINTPETKIWTAENPIEIRQIGLRQVQINPKAGLDFATAMKAFLRADPDVIMVGEMRDHETVATGIEASLTGHLVFTTLHTNSAPESVVRLLDMGMDPFNFADAIVGVLAQRLAKRLCSCKQAYTATPDDIDLLMQEYCLELEQTSQWQKDPAAAKEALRREWVKSFADANGQFTLYRRLGCKKCDGTGYKGRIGLYELMEGTSALKKNILDRARVSVMLATALEDGMRTLKQDGIEKVLKGITDIKQVRAVCIK